jgi:cation diffusion facilitator family transporter
MNDSERNEEKKQAAVSSVIAAVALTSTKIIVGVLTGSLGILAEALHSALDLLAAIVTVFAVHVSGRPADRSHLYGHGKVENLSALFETVLLLVTSVWIIWEAIQRLFFKTVVIEVSVWAYLVMILSIVVDISRSRMLYRVAKKYESQALEADALHFSTDIWSSAVVLVGLVCVNLGEISPTFRFLENADSLAALAVAFIVLFVTFKLGVRTIDSLLDRAPEGLASKIKEIVEKVPGIKNCHRVRVRPSGALVFIDLHVLLDGTTPLITAHELTEQVEEAVGRLVPHADVTVHPEPMPIDPHSHGPDLPAE